ncbi:MGH1-like glycoside hydrolase domain-containing protein [Nonomuraea roseola]|uniref:Mannosylglycerate hydrolase MGH1-like glycoside hydrolase domain-containing protein n=1 Tax=Nonomuraea roseola TaxID=46179 RepID=A0ABV5PU35_9ACTN
MIPFRSAGSGLRGRSGCNRCRCGRRPRPRTWLSQGGGLAGRNLPAAGTLGAFLLDSRRARGREPRHYQHGNDSGWDNATTFDRERVVENADLAAFLVLQMRELARLATDLGDPGAAADWSAAADRMRSTLLAELWDGERFVARGAHSGRTWSSSSLLDLMPIVLCEELPAPVSAARLRST